MTQPTAEQLEVTQAIDQRIERVRQAVEKREQGVQNERELYRRSAQPWDDERLAHAREYAKVGGIALADLQAILLAIQATEARMADAVASLFDAIRHGDAEHQAWLKSAIDAHFAIRSLHNDNH